MAIMNATKAAPFGAITAYRAIHAVEAAVNSLTAWNARRNTYKQLSALSVRELEDIGLTIADVEELTKGTFR
jgi:uncharacterized protein YjiS (DUF1127 family)